MGLSPSQQKAFDLCMSGQNILITGPGGSGKTELIKHIYNRLLKVKKIELTALTGVAAVQIHEQAKTIHSWAGIGLGDLPVNSYINKIKNSTALKNKWKSIEVLVIDEVSMMTDKLLEILNEIGRVIRNNKSLFGGIQIILSGDFYQLPPVKSNSKFCFESCVFKEGFTHKIILSTIFRQKDPTLVNILNNIRLGIITTKDIKKLKERMNINPEGSIQPTYLLPKKTCVESINNEKLDLINEAEIYLYEKKIVEDLPLSKEQTEYMKMLTANEYIQELEFLNKNTMVQEKLRLKKGAQVMSTINILEDEKLIISNGTQGIITKFINGMPMVNFENGVSRVVNLHTWTSHTIPCCGIIQLPIILSWALTIHKAQGCTLKVCRLNIGNDIFEAGQTYVALSRIKTLDGLYLDEFNPYKIKVNAKVKDFYLNIK